MISGQVEKIMQGALGRFAEQNGVEKHNIQLMVHLNGVSEVDESKQGVKYFYCVNGVPKNAEEGYAYLNFNKDILDTKFDPLQRKLLSEDFFRKEILKEAKANKLPEKDILVAIIFHPKNGLLINVMNGTTGKALKVTTLEKVFGE